MRKIEHKREKNPIREESDDIEGRLALVQNQSDTVLTRFRPGVDRAAGRGETRSPAAAKARPVSEKSQLEVNRSDRLRGEWGGGRKGWMSIRNDFSSSGIQWNWGGKNSGGAMSRQCTR